MTDLRHFEDFTPGETFDLGEAEVSEAEIITFAKAFDPSPLHLDHAAAEASPLRGLAASGWHTCGVGMRMIYDALITGVAALGAPGVQECRWTAPLYPAERAGPVSGRAEILAIRPSDSRPEIGFVTVSETLRQRNPFSADTARRPVCGKRYDVMVRRRQPGALDASQATRKPMAAYADIGGAAVPAETGLAFTSAAEIVIGRTTALGETTFDADGIIGFARQFDPQPFHLDREAGAQSLFGGLAASGWHTTAAFSGRMVRSRMTAVAAMPPETQARATAVIGPSPGFTNLRWRRPVLEGDTLRFFATPVEVRDPGPGSGWALAISRWDALNQRGEPAMSLTAELMVRKSNA